MSRGFLPLLVAVLIAGTSALAWETDNLRAFTSTGAQQIEIERTPRSLPDVRLVDQDGNAFSLRAYKGRPVLVDFIYTRCPTICGVRGDDFAHVLELADGSATAASMDLLSISFDPQNDDQEARKLYADRFGAMAPRWRIAAPENADDLGELLQRFGVVVIPDGLGGFTHNSAIYVVDTQGRLVRMLDPDSPPQLFAAATRAVTR